MKKKDWEIKRLGDCFEFIKNGANIKQNFNAGGTPITRIETISNDVFNRDKFGYADIFDFERFEKNLLEDKDILMSHINSVKYLGRAVLYTKQENEIIIHGMNLLNLRTIKTIIQPQYITYYFQSTDFKNQITKITKKAVNQASFTVSALKEFLIPVPPLPIQEQIVKELDTLSDIIAKKRQQITELDMLAQATFYHLFGDPVDNEKGWEKKRLMDVSLSKGEYGANLPSTDFIEGSPRYVRITDIDDFGNLNNNKVSAKTKSDSYRKFLLSKGDILFARTGATVGKTYQYKETDGECIFAGYLIRYVLNQGLIRPIYLFYHTKTNYYKDWVISSQRTVAQPNINAQQYGSFEILLPPLSLQNKFAEQIEAIEKQKELINRTIADTQLLFDYTMDKYFN